MTRTILNHIIWSFSLLAETALITGILSTRKFRFATLLPFWLAFDVLRSLLLFLAPGRIAADDFVTLYSVLSVCGAVLEITLALQLAWFVCRAHNRSRYELLAISIAAWLLTLAFASALPATQLPVDRLELFADVLFVALGIQSLLFREYGDRATVSLGLAVFGIADLSSTAGKTVAALHYNVFQFSTWSYFNSGVWLLILCIWLFTIFRPVPSPSLRLVHRRS